MYFVKVVSLRIALLAVLLSAFCFPRLSQQKSLPIETSIKIVTKVQDNVTSEPQKVQDDVTSEPQNTGNKVAVYNANDTSVDVDESCSTLLDVVFVIDGSSSISKENWVQKMLPFVQGFSRRLKVGENDVRVAAVMYGSNVTITWRLDSRAATNKSILLQQLSLLRQPTGNTNTTHALITAKKVLNGPGSRINASKLVVLITDGKANYPDSARFQANILRQKNVTVFAVGIGTVDTNELLSYAGCQSIINCKNYTRCSWTVLLNELPSITKTICKTMPKDAKCNDWADWSSCSVSCGPGVRKRERKYPQVLSEAQAGDNGMKGRTCQEQGLRQAMACYERRCPIDARCGTTFGKWSKCSATCGPGTQTRKRLGYNMPPAAYGGKSCEQQNVAPSETRQCNERPCPIDAGCGQWLDWSTCSATCGTGEMVRKRSVYNQPSARFGGRSCENQKILKSETKKCQVSECPVDATCGSWSDWSPCSTTCGEGEMTREREGYDDTPPAFGGKTCEQQGIKRKETMKCKEMECPINAKCGDWGNWGACESDCGGGERKRQRIGFNNPPASHGGLTCEEQHITEFGSQPCNTHECPADASCGTFTDWSPCSKECGGGKRERTRQGYNDPPAKNDGLTCKQQGKKKKEEESCNTHPCPINATCGPFDPWSPCSKTCGPGEAVRVRPIYNDPPAQFGGKTCEERGLEKVATKRCYAGPCPIDQDCGEPGDWNECSASCGGGVQSRYRTGYGYWKRPRYGGKTCEERGIFFTETRACNTEPCPKDAFCGDWTEWGKCSVSCGGGKQTRSRKGYNSIPAEAGGKTCKEQGLEEIQENVCGMQECPIDAKCGDWGNWCACSVTCGKGKRVRTRLSYNSPGAMFGGLTCEAQGIPQYEEDTTCNPDPCPVDAVPGDWKKWSDCSATCGSGYRIRVREPMKVENKNGGKTLAEQNISISESEECFSVPCGPCTYDWANWGMCSMTCGEESTRTRHTAVKYDLPEGRCNLPTYETEYCTGLPFCPGDNPNGPIPPPDAAKEESNMGGSKTNKTTIAGGVVGGLALLAAAGGGAYYAKSRLGNTPAPESAEAEYDSNQADQHAEEEDNEEAMSLDADSDFWT